MAHDLITPSFRQGKRGQRTHNLPSSCPCAREETYSGFCGCCDDASNPPEGCACVTRPELWCRCIREFGPMNSAAETYRSMVPAPLLFAAHQAGVSFGEAMWVRDGEHVRVETPEEAVPGEEAEKVSGENEGAPSGGIKALPIVYAEVRPLPCPSGDVVVKKRGQRGPEGKRCP